MANGEPIRPHQGVTLNDDGKVVPITYGEHLPFGYIIHNDPGPFYINDTPQLINNRSWYNPLYDAYISYGASIVKPEMSIKIADIDNADTEIVTKNVEEKIFTETCKDLIVDEEL